MIHFNQYYPHSNKILIRKFEGVVEVDDIIASWEYLLKNKLISNETIGVVNVVTDRYLKLNMESFSKLISILK